jgi:hypothetical protein
MDATTHDAGEPLIFSERFFLFVVTAAGVSASLGAGAVCGWLLSSWGL